MKKGSDKKQICKGPRYVPNSCIVGTGPKITNAMDMENGKHGSSGTIGRGIETAYLSAQVENFHNLLNFIDY